MAQFSPALIGGLYWRGGSKQGVYAGLLAGFGMWAYTLLLPTVLRSLPAEYSHFTESFLNVGPMGINWLRPEALLGFESFAALTHGVVWALGLNIILYIWISRIFAPAWLNKFKQKAFSIMKPSHCRHRASTDISYIHHDVARLKVGDLITLAKRITGDGATMRAFQQFCAQNNVVLNRKQQCQRHVVAFYRTIFAGTIGAASARTLLTTAMVNNGLALGQVANILTKPHSGNVLIKTDHDHD